MGKTPLEKEIGKLLLKEKGFINKHARREENFLEKKVENIVPVGLQDKLDKAFYKAFKLIFDRGTPFIEKTYSKDSKDIDFMINEYKNNTEKSRKNLQAFSKNAAKTSGLNLLAAGTAGVGMGIFGVGLPDIPIFLSMQLKTIYEIALSYGYEYDTMSEKLFILEIIRAALSYGDEFVICNKSLDEFIDQKSKEGMSKSEEAEVDEGESGRDLDDQIKYTAESLSRELLYMKFIQTIPVVGMLGGLSDLIYGKKIADCAKLKYQKRYLLTLQSNQDDVKKASKYYFD